MKYSPYADSLDDHLLRKKKPRRQPSLWKWLLAIGLGLFFVYRSTLPVVRLQSEPPPAFIDHNLKRNHGPVQPETRVARAYWKVAVQSIQLEYSPKRSLPAVPPPEFKINSQLSELSDRMNSDRAFYWRRLRDLWTQPEIWQVSYGWSTEWFTNSILSLQQSIGQAFEQFVESVSFWKDDLGKSGIS